MIRNRRVSYGFCCLAVMLAMVGAGCSKTDSATARIVDKNVEARGGLKVWRAVKTLSMAGRMDAGKARPDIQKTIEESSRPGPHVRKHIEGAVKTGTEVEQTIQLPFAMELERPRKVRLEIQFQGQTAVQVYDGVNGWKLRPFMGRKEAEPFTADELKAASEQQDLDGPLIDYDAKGSKVELEGTEAVEGRDAYKLKLTLKDGQVRRVWVDKETFLDVKIDGNRRLDGKPRPIATYFRDYKSVDGLLIPYVLETRVEGISGSEKIIVERVAVNPKIDDAHFQKPQ